MIPWRVKNFVSAHWPLAYHVVANLGMRGNSERHWDEALAASWNDDSRAWPSKREIMLARTRPEMAILDVACGTGDLVRALRGHGYRNLYALDISAYAVRRLNEEGITARCGKLPNIDFPDGSFDVVIASQVLEHIVRRNRFAQEIRRVLKPGGAAFIFVPDNCLGPIDEPEHVIAYTAETLRRFLGQHFIVDSIDSMRDRNHAMPILFAHVMRPA